MRYLVSKRLVHRPGEGGKEAFTAAEPATESPPRASPVAVSVNTSYLYVMSSRLLNVRLDENRLRKVRKLRETGVTLSDVVRDAIDARYEALARPMTARHAMAVINRILEQYPDRTDQPARSYDVHDSRAAHAAISRALKRRPR